MCCVMAKRKTRNVGNAFCSSLFMESAENTIKIKNTPNNPKEDFYCIGEIVNLDDTDFCITGIFYDEDTVEIQNSTFPIDVRKFEFSEFLNKVKGPKQFKNHSNKQFDISKYIGCEYEDNGRNYKVKSFEGDNVIIEDLTMQLALGVTQEQKVTIDYVKPLLKENAVSTSKAKKVIPKAKVVHKKIDDAGITTSLFDLFELTYDDNKISDNHIQPKRVKTDFVITESEEYRTKGMRIDDNLQAIKLVKKLKSEGRFATAEEQLVLSKYSGWGGLADVFEKNKHVKQYKEVLDTLTPEEYIDARASILNAFYTPKTIIDVIYSTLNRFGFKGGRILEPSMGIGKFFGCMPKNMRKNSTLYGIEIDDISAEISRQLYQNATILHKGFEKVDYGENVFDLAISNVPFGQYSVSDGKYNRYKYKIHDYFICKMIDCVRPGGLVVALTSSCTLDKQISGARNFIAEKAELIGAIRLPNKAFGNAHTETIVDLLFFKKRDEPLKSVNECWLDTTQLEFENGDKKPVKARTNDYFILNKNHVLGDWKVVSGQYGDVITISGDFNQDECLDVLSTFDCKYKAVKKLKSIDKAERLPIPEELLNVPNYSYLIYESSIWFRNNGIIERVTPANKTAEKRLRALIPLRDILLELFEAQLNAESDETITELQNRLDCCYDSFVNKYGRVSSRANSLAFRQDSKYPLLCSLEIFNDEGEFERKADVFTKRTIKTSNKPFAENEVDALEISLAEKGCIDFNYMTKLTGFSEEELTEKLCLSERLFKLPFKDGYETADTYLSGYVKDKLKLAKTAAEKDEQFKVNVSALERVQPKDIPYNEIFAPMGATWIDTKFYKEFLYELLQTPVYMQNDVDIVFLNDNYHITRKNIYDVKSTSVYGTNDKNGYELFEDCLNLRTTKVYDYWIDDAGKQRSKVNVQKTQVVQTKQESIRQKFNDWIWSDYDRREYLVRKYNDTMNNIVERDYDGSKIQFSGMNPNIVLMPHQKNAVARIIRSGNTLLAHVVGAGKTFTMIAAAMEKKRLGLHNKPLFVVPNHLVEQWAGEFLRLYPCANVLITGKGDFSKNNRQKFCARIATGNYDAVIMSHDQFTRVPLSEERQCEEMNRQLIEIDRVLNELNIEESEDSNFKAKKYTVRQYEQAKANLICKMEFLNSSPKDNTVTFEELGVDALFLDEAHLFKNLAVVTKLNNVAGLTNSNSKKASDLLMKVNYLNEITDYKGVVFATGTPVSNAVCELYVMQEYLQKKDLELHGIYTFDSWISRFAETEAKVEVKPEGTGYRTVTRVSKYHNLPELMTLFRMVADIRVAEQLDLDVPERKNHNVAVNPSKTQQDIIKMFAKRAEDIRCGNVDRQIDNMLCVTNDGRKLAIDQRLYNMDLDDDKKSKLNRMTRTVHRIWKLFSSSKGTQLVFSDMGTPKKGNAAQERFDVYADCKNKLISYGVPENEIAFIHDANTDQRKKALFEKVNKGIVRILIGSTEKLGAGTNVQKRLVAIHNLDCPWRPSDLEQRAGRIIRQGNMNDKAYVYSYVTKNTFDTYLYQTVLAKAQFINQIMSGKSLTRDMDDVDTSCLNYAEITALSTGNPAIKEKMELEEKVAKLRNLRSNYVSQKYDLESQIKIYFPKGIKSDEAKIFAIEKDIEMVNNNYLLDEEYKFSPMKLDDTTYRAKDKKECAEHLQIILESIRSTDCKTIGNYRGFNLSVHYDVYKNEHVMYLISPKTNYSYPVALGYSGIGNITRINNLISNLEDGKNEIVLHLEELNKNFARAKVEYEKPFEFEEEYQEAIYRLAELDKKLALEGSGGVENIVA